VSTVLRSSFKQKGNKKKKRGGEELGQSTGKKKKKREPEKTECILREGRKKGARAPSYS